MHILVIITRQVFSCIGGIMNMKQELDELKYQYDKAVRVKDNLLKNMERRKKLNLLGSDEEDSLKDDIAEATRQAEDLKKQMRSLESRFARARTIAETNESSPWSRQ
jgi:predicted nuclease with TOPRIM domain